jgi:hypothetical protein
LLQLKTCTFRSLATVVHTNTLYLLVAPIVRRLIMAPQSTAIILGDFELFPTTKNAPSLISDIHFLYQRVIFD